MKKLKATFKNLIKKMIPKFIMRKIFFTKIDLEKIRTSNSDLQFRIAKTKNEYEDAFELLQFFFFEADIISEDKKYYINKHNANSSTYIINGYLNNEIVCTISVVNDSIEKLPIDSFTNLDKFRIGGKKLVCMSQLAVAKSWRSKGSSLVLQLVMTTLHFIKNNLKADYAFVMTSASATFVTRNMMFFNPLTSNGHKVDGINDKNIKLSFIDFDEDLKKMKNYCKNLAESKNIFKALNDELPWKDRVEFTGITIAPQSYNFDKIKAELINPNFKRENKRLDTSMKLQVVLKDKVESLHVVDISQNGVRVIIPSDFKEENIQGRIYLGQQSCSVSFVVKWTKGNFAGLELSPESRGIFSNQFEDFLQAA